MKRNVKQLSECKALIQYHDALTEPHNEANELQLKYGFQDGKIPSWVVAAIKALIYRRTAVVYFTYVKETLIWPQKFALHRCSATYPSCRARLTCVYVTFVPCDPPPLSPSHPWFPSLDGGVGFVSFLQQPARNALVVRRYEIITTYTEISGEISRYH